MLLSAMFVGENEKLDFQIPKRSPWPIFLPGSVIIPTPKVVSEFEFGLQSNTSKTNVDKETKKYQDTHG
jgi:hypothetical protein